LRGKIPELLTGVEDKFQLSQERIRMETNTPIEIHQVTVDVVEDFDLRAWLCQENRQTSGEWFHIACMPWDLRDDVLNEATLASWPCDGGLKSRLDGHCIELRCALVGLVVVIKSTGEITADGKISHFPILSNKKTALFREPF
jgi:hypothetical protein